MNGSFDENDVKVISGLSGPPSGQYFGESNLNAWGSDVKAKFKEYVDIYGSVSYNNNESEKILTVGDIVIQTSDIMTQSFDVYEKCGFVEGVARITTPVGDAACVVKNGTLYPILTEYDQATEDNWTLQDVYLNGDNEVSNLQQMVDRSGSYLAYTEDQEADKWSPIENYLHMHVKMPIVPKIGYVPAEQVGLGNVLPGLNYAVTL